MNNSSSISRKLRLAALYLFPVCLSVAFQSNLLANPVNSNSPEHQRRASISYAKARAGTLENDSMGGGTSALVSQQDESTSTLESSQEVDHLVISNLKPVQGETIMVSSSHPGEVKFNNESVSLFADAADGQPRYSALIAIPAQLKPGTYQLLSGGLVESLAVGNAHYGTQRLSLPKSKDNFQASPGEKEQMEKAKKTVSPEKMWSGVFQHPVKHARLSTRFGLKRIVNGKPLKDYFHSGTDFAAPQGTPVLAAAPGRVIVAHTGWRLHGNTVCIDHGRGVVSISIHMNTIKVKPGDTVEAGQQIGTVGKTGRASGPHLHYGIYVNNVASNPDYWFRNTY